MSEADLPAGSAVACLPSSGGGEVARQRARRNAMDRFIDGIELIAAFFIGLVALDIFVSVLLRYFFSVQIPDSYDFGRLLLGI